METRALAWTITTWNLRGTAKPDMEAVAASIATESPDVVVLQEVRKGQAVDLATRLGMKFTWSLKHYPFTPLLAAAVEGLAILTPHALDAAGHTEVSKRRSTWTYKRRIAQWCLVGRSDSSAYRVYNVHLSPGDGGDAALERREQAVTIAELVAGHGDAPPAIVAGDFNDDTDASIIFALPGVEHITPMPTNPAGAPTQILDHVLLPPDASGVATTVPTGGPDWATLSDHLPVTVRFDLDWVHGDFDSIAVDERSPRAPRPGTEESGDL